LNAAIAQVAVSYNAGIALKDDDSIPPFSEIHTLVLVKVEGAWLISAQDIVQQNSLKYGEASIRSPDPAHRAE
jgi:hypothetical protein